MTLYVLQVNPSLWDGEPLYYDGTNNGAPLTDAKVFDERDMKSYVFPALDPGLFDRDSNGVIQGFIQLPSK